MSRHSSRGPEWEALRLEVLARDPMCTYCKVKPSTQADHVIPKADPDSPGDVLSNLVGACQPCNARKGSKTITRKTWLNPRWIKPHTR